jgi:hypothetical protein
LFLCLRRSENDFNCIPFYTEIANVMSNLFTEIKDDPESIMLLCDTLNRSESWRLAMLHAAGAWDKKEAMMGRYEDEFLRARFVSYVNIGLDEQADTVYADLEKRGFVNNAVRLRRAIMQGRRNKVVEAENVLASGDFNKSIGAEKTFERAVRAYVRLLRGDKKAVTNYVDSIQTTDRFDGSTVFFVEYLKSKANGKLPSATLVKLMIQGEGYLHDVWCMGINESLESSGKDNAEVAKTIRNGLPFFTMTEPLNILLQKACYPDGESWESYIGEYSLEGDFEFDGRGDPSTLNLKVDKDGNVSGELKVQGNEGTLPISGTVGDFGRAVLKVNFGDVEANAVMMLVPAKLYKNLSQKEFPYLRLTIYSISPSPFGFYGKRKQSGVKPEIARNWFSFSL